MLQDRFTSYQLGLFSILLAATLWGTTGTVASFAPNISSLAMGAFSMGVGGIFQACLSVKAVKKDFEKVMLHKKTLMVSIIALVVYPLAFYSSMRLAGVAIGTVISISTAPFFSVLLECLFSKNTKVTKQWLLSFVVGVAGIMLLVTSESSSINDNDQDMRLVGIVLGFVSGMTYATY